MDPEPSTTTMASDLQLAVSSADNAWFPSARSKADAQAMRRAGRGTLIPTAVGLDGQLRLRHAAPPGKQPTFAVLLEPVQSFVDIRVVAYLAGRRHQEVGHPVLAVGTIAIALAAV